MKQQSIIEEIFNSITHGIGFTFGLVGLVLLVDMAIRTGDRVRIVGFSIYGVTLILLYLMSTLYHGARSARAKHILRICDHASIYLLIAGSYTPFCLVVLPSFWGTLMMAILWPLAVLGIIFKIFYVGKYDFLSTLFYIGMGCLTLIAVDPLLACLSWYGFLWFVIGGALYILGTIFYAIDKIPFNHVIWHLFVLSGSACHFLAIFLYVAPFTGIKS